MQGQRERLKAVICDEIDRIVDDNEVLTAFTLTVQMNESGIPRVLHVERRSKTDLVEAHHKSRPPSFSTPLASSVKQR